jgi:hypothetical protein
MLSLTARSPCAHPPGLCVDHFAPPFRHAAAYFFGKDLSVLPQLLLGPLVYCAIFLSITYPRGSFAKFYVVMFGAMLLR